MTLNRTIVAPSQPSARARLDGVDRGIDVAVGLVILITEVLIGYLVIDALFRLGTAAGTSTAAFGFAVALFGSGFFFLTTTIGYLVRLARGRRSWSSPLWGIILIAVASLIGFLIMSGEI